MESQPNGEKELDLIPGPDPQISEGGKKNQEMDRHCQDYEHLIQNRRSKW